MSIQLYEQDLTKHRRGYMCKSTDVANLPHNADIELPEEKMYTGCYAYCVDNGDTYMFDAESDTWIQQ